MGKNLDVCFVLVCEVDRGDGDSDDDIPLTAEVLT